MSKYPVGATWKASDKKNEIAQITLKHRTYTRQHVYEQWVWSCSMKAFYGWNFDWNTSYRRCRADITYNFPSFDGIRFRRAKSTFLDEE